MSDTNFNSQCESGWTMYLDQPCLSENEFNTVGGILGEEQRLKAPCFREEEEEEEDLSMVSDASSGPPFYSEDWFSGDRRSTYPSSVTESAMESQDKKKKKKTKKVKDRVKSQQHSHLDDTASSPAFISSTSKVFRNEAVKEKGLNLSLTNSSAKHKKGKSSSTKSFGFFGSSFEEKPPAEE